MAAAMFSSASLHALDFLPADSLIKVKFKQTYLEAKNQKYYVLGKDLKGDFYSYNGIKLDYFKPSKWVLTPLMNGEILYADDKKVRFWYPYKGEEGDVLFKTKEKGQIECLAFSPEGTYILVVTKDNNLHKVLTDAKMKEKVQYSTPLSGTPSKLQFNDQANVALILEGDKVEIFNLERGVNRKTLTFAQNVLDVDFSESYREFAVLLADGSIKTYNVSDLNEKKSFAPIAGALNCIYFTQDKYLIVNAGKSIEMINLLTSNVDYVITVDGTEIMSFDLLKDSNEKDQLFYVKNDHMGIYPLTGIERYHTMDMKYSMDLAMSDWAKMQDGETEDEYRQRVTDENREKYALQLEYDLVSQMAGNLINEDGARFGNYVGEEELLAVDFNTLPTIYLNIPSAELTQLNDVEDIEFFNTIYGLDKDDKFEVIYTDARNKHTGSVYMYDNRNREKISFEQNDFVPMEVIQLANVESAKLETMKQEVVEQAKTENMLSDHTHITVNTEVQDELDADGNKILNYNVNYQYQVEEEFSERDDFRAGKYVATESNAAKQMLAIVEKSMSEDFAKYMTDCSKVVINVTGSADATPIRGRVRYNGEYGEIVDQLATQDGELTTMTVTKSKGMTSNEELALVRAIGVADYLKNGSFNKSTVPVEYKYNVEVSKEKGSEYRRIKVSVKFVDTFKQQMNK